MQSHTPTRRPNLSEEIGAAVRRRIVQGRIAPGVRINEVHLAAELGVSRTPLREALMSLVAEGSIHVEPRRGFFARPLSLEEFEQVVLIRALLDPAALEIAGLPSRPQLQRLRGIQRRLESARDPERVIALDEAWHLELLAHCPNGVLLGLIRQFMARTHRYELVLMRERGSVQRVTGDHARILSALAAGNLAGAATELRKNMQSGSATIRAWLARKSAQ